MNTRTVLFLAGSTASLAAGAAFALQTVRKQPAEATPVTAIAAPVEAVGPVAPTVAENVTPLTARMVQTVLIHEPGAAPNTTAAYPAETGDAANVETAPGVGQSGHDHPSTAAASSTLPAVASLIQEQSDAGAGEQAAPITAPAPKASHPRKRSSTAAKQSRSAKPKAEVAAAQEPPPPQQA
jgi:hypothetical protein